MFVRFWKSDPNGGLAYRTEIHVLLFSVENRFILRTVVRLTTLVRPYEHVGLDDVNFQRFPVRDFLQ